MDCEAVLVNAIADARASSATLSITGHGSKAHWLAASSGQMLTTAEHTGIVEYQPSELVVTVRAGTPIKDLVLELAQNQQALASDPPQLGGLGTVGGAMAAGFSGPARPWQGSLRGAVLGTKVINGKAEVLQFGGQVMKNVAGYDVSRLMAGSFGSLAVLLEMSLRVRPKDSAEMTLVYSLGAKEAVEFCCATAGQPLPLSASFWSDGQLYLRFSGSEAGVKIAHERLGGEPNSDANLWRFVRDHQLPIFKAASPDRSMDAKLFRLVTPPAAPLPEIDEAQIAIEWGGGQRWVWHTHADAMTEYAQSVGGWSWQIGKPLMLEPAHQRLMARIKHAYDPDALFNSPLKFGGMDAH
jgi:glycolate oxidase FAD binding subunit